MTDLQVNKYFGLARNASSFSDFPRVHIGAIFTYKNRIIATGWNTTKENPIQKHYNQCRGFDTNSYKNSLHAEMMCLVRSKDYDVDWKKVNVFVYRALKNGKISLAKPCIACETALKEKGIKNVYYTTVNGYAHERWN